jgi:ribosomal protein S18 acetylase RimI-like enzyme
VTVREMAQGDLARAAEFCERARAADPSIEPFGSRLGAIAKGPRALFGLWRIAREIDAAVEGIAFVALREPRSEPRIRPAKADLYAAVGPGFRRKGVGSELCAPALQWAAREGATLRARVLDGALAGQAFLTNLGFRQTSAQLLLTWSRPRIGESTNTSVRVKQVAVGEALPQLERLSRDAWAGAPDRMATGSDELAQLSREEGRLSLIAEMGGSAVGYLSGIWLGKTLGIDEIAVLPECRRKGIGWALLRTSVRDATSAVLSVMDTNRAALALYRSFGFTQSARRLVYELPHG